MTFLKPILFALGLSLVSASHSLLFAVEQVSAMTAVDILELASLSDPVISSDQSKVAFLRSEADWNKNRRVENIWVYEVPTKISRQLTFDYGDKSQLAWSPDGNYLSFVARPRGDEEKKDDSHKGIFLMPMNGGDAFLAANHAADVRDYQWAPDGLSIYFLANVPETEEFRKRRKDKDDMFAFEQAGSQRQLWKVSLYDGSISRLGTGEGHVLDFTLSPDGSLIAYSLADSVVGDSSHTADIWLLDGAASGTDSIPRRLTDNDHAEKKIAISPDNKYILYIADINADGDYYYDANVFVIAIDTGESRLLAEDQTFEVEDTHWSENSDVIYIRANMGVRSEIWSISRTSGRSKQLSDAVHTIKDWQFNPAAGQHVFVAETPVSPGEISTMRAKGGEISALTDVFAGLDQRFQLPRQELVQFTASDGTRLEGLLSYPLNYQSGSRYPLVVDLHGGPRSSEQYGQLGWRSYIPLLAANSYLHFAPNYRGGRGYGDEFMRDMVGGFFNNAHTDILAGIDQLIAMGIADPDRLAVRGWSAGGHLTNKLITYTDRFKAASSGAGAIEWTSMYGESDIRFSRTPWFGGSPWQKDAPLVVYQEQSPLKDLWKARTPTIIFAGEKDERVPPTQSIILFRALRDLGVESEFYLAPREPHGFKELRHRLFKINAELGWFEKYVNGRDYSWESAPQ